MFVNSIRQKQVEKGLTQTKLAALVGVANQALSEVSLGKRQSWPKLRKDLARVLGCSEVELFPPEQPTGVSNGS